MWQFLGGGTGTLDGLVGSHTRLVIYPTLAIHYRRVVIHALLDTRFKGEVGSDLPSYHQTTKVTLTEGSPERSRYMHMDKQVRHSILDMLFSKRGTETAKVEGLWLVNRPRHLVPEYLDNSPDVWWCSPFIFPSLYSTRDPCDIISWCHNCLLWSSSGKTTVHAHGNCRHSSVHLLASLLEPPNTTNASKPLHLFFNLIFVPVTLSPRYFSVPSYQSFNLFTYSQQNTGKHYNQTRMMNATYQLTNTIK